MRLSHVDVVRVNRETTSCRVWVDNANSSLIGRATERLADRPMLHAFDFASALSLGLEALPMRHRASTDRALRDAGFTGRDLWLRPPDAAST
ncbi:MAG: hypothetical protein GEU83_19065 [Pseudonocardiaceae bacterium]|nr:hypothetical protein [Pseudonocardiaceae bacterium]